MVEKSRGRVPWDSDFSTSCHPSGSDSKFGLTLRAPKKDSNVKCVTFGLAASLGLTLCLGPIIFIIILTQVQTAPVNCETNRILNLVEPCDFVIDSILMNSSKRFGQHGLLFCCSKLVLMNCFDAALVERKCKYRMNASFVSEHVNMKSAILNKRSTFLNMNKSYFCRRYDENRCAPFIALFRQEIQRFTNSSLSNLFHGNNIENDTSTISLEADSTTAQQDYTTLSRGLEIIIKLDVYNDTFEQGGPFEELADIFSMSSPNEYEPFEIETDIESDGSDNGVAERTRLKAQGLPKADGGSAVDKSIIRGHRDAPPETSESFDLLSSKNWTASHRGSILDSLDLSGNGSALATERPRRPKFVEANKAVVSAVTEDELELFVENEEKDDSGDSDESSITVAGSGPNDDSRVSDFANRVNHCSVYFLTVAVILSLLRS